MKVNPRVLPATVSWRGMPAPPIEDGPYASSHHIKAARGFVRHMGKEHGVTVMRRRHLPMCLYSPLELASAPTS